MTAQLPLFAQILGIQPSEFWALTPAEYAACIDHIETVIGG